VLQTELNWIGLDWIGLDWIGLDWIGGNEFCFGSGTAAY
jgi:hypothetical protein